MLEVAEVVLVGMALLVAFAAVIVILASLWFIRAALFNKIKM